MPENNDLAWEDDEIFSGGSTAPETKAIATEADNWGDDDVFAESDKAEAIENAKTDPFITSFDDEKPGEIETDQGFKIPSLGQPALSRGEKDFEDKTGGTFLGRLENNISIAAKNVQRSYYGMKMSEFAGIADLYKQPKYTPEYFDKNPKEKAQLEAALENYMDNAAEFVQIGIDQQNENATRPALEKVMRQQGDRSLTDKALEIGEGVADDPLGVVGDLTIQSMPMMLEAIATVAAIRGAGGSNKVAAMGGGTVSGLNEFGSDYAQLRLEGESHNDAWGTAATRAGIIGLFDAVSFKTAGGALEEILDATVGNKLKTLAKETGQQMALGAGGEFVGTEVSGRDAELGDVAAEAIGEVGGVFIEGPAMLARRDPKDNTNKPEPDQPGNDPLDADSDVFGTESNDSPIDLTEADTGEPLALPAPVMEVDSEGNAATTAQREQAEADQLANDESLGIEEGDRKAIARVDAIDAQSPAAARRTMQERLPENFTDPRLGRDTYRDALESMISQDFVEGGGVALVPDENFVRGEGDSGNVPLKRTPSLNPDWAQTILQEEEISVKDVNNAVKQALAGKKLGVRQSRVITSLLDQATGERTDLENIESVQAARKEAQDLRKIARGEFVPNEAYEETIAEHAGEVYAENNYDPMWDGQTRSFYELYNEASEINAEATEALFEGMYGTDADLPGIAKALYAQVINNDLTGEQNENGANTTNAGLPARADQTGQGNGVHPDSASIAGSGPGPAIERNDRPVKPGLVGAEAQVEPVSDIAEPVMSESVSEVDTEQKIAAAVDNVQATVAQVKPSGRREQSKPVANDHRYGERREDVNHRKDINTMSADEKNSELEKLRKERLENPKTKIAGRTAFEEDAELGWDHVAALDGDGIGFFNDTLGHDPTDEILKLIASEVEKFNTDTVRFYHLNGDEFAGRSENEADLKAQSAKVQKHLEKTTMQIDTLLPDGERLDVNITGFGMSYGIGDSYESADIKANESKGNREQEGKRAKKGSNPGGIKLTNPRSGREGDLSERGLSKDRALEVIEETGKDSPPDKKHPGLKKPKATSETEAAPKGAVSASGAMVDPQEEFEAVIDELPDNQIDALYKAAKLPGPRKTPIDEKRAVLRGKPESVIYPIYEELADSNKLPTDPNEEIDITKEEDWDIEVANFPEPSETVNAIKNSGEYIDQSAAEKILQQWKDKADEIGRTEDHSNEVIISLFDASGAISEPWRRAGYTILQYDIKLGDDLLEFFPTGDLNDIEESGKKVVGVIAQPPCTCFTSTGSQWWKKRHDKHDKEMVNKMFGPKAAQYFSKPTEYTKALVSMTDLIIEFTNPDFYTLENPNGGGGKTRIGKLTGLPEPTLILQPNNYGDPYTKKTLLWGKFNTDLPTANVEPTKGSLMHKMWSSAEKNGGKRSETPEGFSYAFFMANHKQNANKKKLHPGKKAENNSESKVYPVDKDLWPEQVAHFIVKDGYLLAKHSGKIFENSKGKWGAWYQEDDGAVKQLTNYYDKQEDAIKEAINDYGESEKYDPSKVSVNDIDEVAHEAATSPKNNLPEPTEAQKEAGNYQKGHVTIQGIDIAIENPAGSKRNEAWPALKHHYGYIKKTKGADGDHVDVFIGNGEKVFIVDQVNKDGSFDEHKVMLGFNTKMGATKAYNSNYEKGWTGKGAITEMGIDEFRTWLEGDTTKPIAYKQKLHPGKKKTKPKKPVSKGLEAMNKALESVGIDPNAPVDKSKVLIKKAEALMKESEKMLSGIVPGQPVLSTRDKNLREKAAAKARKAGELYEQADKLDKDKAPEGSAVRIIKTDTGYKATYTDDTADFESAELDGYLDDAYKRKLFDNVLDKYITLDEANEILLKDNLDHPEAYTGTVPKAVEVKSKKSTNNEPVTESNDNQTLYEVHDSLINSMQDGELTLEQYRKGFEDLAKNRESIIAELSKETKNTLLDRMDGMTASRYKSEKKARAVQALYTDMLTDFLPPSSDGGMYSYSPKIGGDYIQNIIDAVREKVNSITEEKLQAYAKRLADSAAERKAEQAKQKEKNKAALADPKSIEDFNIYINIKASDENISKQEAYDSLSSEQRAKFDELLAEKSRDRRKALKDSDRSRVDNTGVTTGTEIIQTKHTRDGYDLFVVQTAERVEKDVYYKWLSAAKKMGGWYSRYRGNGATPGFQFKELESAEAFQSYVTDGDSDAVKEKAKERRDAYVDDKSQSAVERLTEMADKLESKSQESLDAPRKTNTARRAGMAASAEAKAEYGKSIAKTMRNIASAIDEGKTKFLELMRTKTQVEMLGTFISLAKDEQIRKTYPDYSDQLKHQGEPVDNETVDYVTWPALSAYRSDLAKLGRELSEIDGLKKIGKELLKVADDVTDTYLDYARANLTDVAVFKNKSGGLAAFSKKGDAEASIIGSGFRGQAIVLPVKRGENLIILSPAEAQKRGAWEGDNDKRITLRVDLVEQLIGKTRRLNNISVPWQLDNAFDKRKRLKTMGIETQPEFRSALREFIKYREEQAKPDKVKELERKLVGRRKDGLDFFPTPERLADEMIETAGIEEGMKVLEPSAGMGHIADRIREAGVEPDVIEMSGDRRELLEAKGYELAGYDFLEHTDGGYDRIIMNPPFSDSRDAEHIQHAYNLLKPGGQLVAIAGEGIFFRGDKKATAFREWMEKVGASDEKLEEGTFNDPSLPVTTGVNARMLVIEKGGESKFSRTSFKLTPIIKAAKSGLSVSAVTKSVTQITNDWKNSPDIEIVATQSELPNEILSYANEGDVIEGVFHNGRVFLVAENLRNQQHLEFTLLHESLLHFGVRETFGGVELDKILNTIWDTNEEVRKIAAKKMIQFNIDKTDAVEEVLADMAGHGKSKPTTGLKRFIEFIKNWLIKHGFLKLNANDIVDYVLNAASNAVVKGKGKDNFDYVSAYSKQSPDNAFSKESPTFYSQMQTVLQNKLPGKGEASQLKKVINSFAKKGEFKAEELEWSGVNEWLDSQLGKKISKQEVIDFLKANDIQIEEVEKGEAGGSDMMSRMEELKTSLAMSGIRLVMDGDGVPNGLKVEGSEPLYFEGNEFENGLFDESETFIPDDARELMDKYMLKEILAGASIASNDVIEKEIAEVYELTKEYELDADLGGYHGGDGSVNTKYSDWTLPGGENYTELLLRMPIEGAALRERGLYASGHWRESNILATVRYNERTDVDNNKILFIEEIQSDWHQDGRKKGYAEKELTETGIKLINKRIKELNEEIGISTGDLSRTLAEERRDLINKINDDSSKNTGKVPDAPFKTTWPMLAFKRMIRHASENGFDSIAWTTGEQQADRYDLSKQIESIHYGRENDFVAYNKDGDQVIGKTVSPDELESVIGKEVAKKIINLREKQDQGRVKIIVSAAIEGGLSEEQAKADALHIIKEPLDTEDRPTLDQWKRLGEAVGDRIDLNEIVHDFKYDNPVVLENTDLQVGGEGMKGFYDNMLPKMVNKYVKKWGGKVDTTEINLTDLPDSEFDGYKIGHPYRQKNKPVVHSLGVTEKMKEAAMTGQPMFSRNTEDNQLDEGLSNGQPIDKVFRKAFEIAQIPKVTKAIHDQGVKYLTESKFNEDSPMSWLNGPIETARAGLIDRYGLDQDYVQRDFQREADKRKIELKAVDYLQSIADHVSNPQEASVLQAVLTGEKIPEGDWAKLAQPIRDAIDDLGREAMELGLIPRESYERNKGSYLHRVYKGHESSQTKLGKWVSNIGSSRRKRIRGDELKARGMTMNTGMDKLLSALPKDWWGLKEQDGRADQALKGKEFYVFDKLAHTGEGTMNLPGMGEKQTGKLKERVYWPADKPLPKKYEAWEARGKWQVRDIKGDKVVLWRDFTKEERTNMGEILDARYTMTKTFMLMAHDLSTGRFLKDVAENDNWARRERPAINDEFIEDSPERRRGVSVYSDVAWVKVPEGSIGGASVKKWGALAGMYVRSEIWRDLNELDRMQLPGFWKSILTQWKLNKTARNPVVHMNNVMSNLVFMDMADIRWVDLKRAIHAYRNKDADYQDALEHGAFGASYIEHEIRRDILDPIIEEIMNQDKAMKKGAIEAYMDDKEMLAKVAVLGKMLDSGIKTAQWADKKMTDVYQFEDEIFRLATYIRRRSLGDDTETAARVGRDQFLNYDIRAPWVNAARNSFLPFISYTYRAVPVIAKSISERPWKIAKYSTIAYMVNALGYALAPGDEDEERRSMREQEQGKTWLGTPRMIRMPGKDEHGNPLFLDIRRWIPAGDVFDTNQSNGAVPIPAWLQFGGPLMIAAELSLNKQAFSGREIINRKTDEWDDIVQKDAMYLWRSWMPSAPWVPGGWYWDKIGRSVTGGRDVLGNEYSLPMAALSSTGIKIKSHDVDLNFSYKGREIQSVIRALTWQMKDLERDKARNLINEGQYQKEKESIKRKMKNLEADAKETFGK